MLKISEVVEVHAKAFRDSSVDGIRVNLDNLKASDWLGALLTEMRRAFEATSEYEGLVRRSDGRLANHGLSRKDIPNQIYRRYYAD
jgi:hypothetical protein